MELSVKHLAPYLPYELKLQLVINAKVHSTGIMSKIIHNNFETHPTKICINYQDAEYIWMFRPLLRPLSAFTEECHTDLANEFMRQWCDAYTEYFNIWFNDVANVDKLIFQCPQEIFNWFLENHFDVYGLIPAGLAVEII